MQLTAGGTIGVAAKDGKLLWRYKKLGGNTANIPTPIVLGDQVFTAAGYGKGGALLTLSARRRTASRSKEEYYNDELKNKHGGVTIVGDYVYGDTDDSGSHIAPSGRPARSKWTREADAARAQGSACDHLRRRQPLLPLPERLRRARPGAGDGYAEEGSFKIAEQQGPELGAPRRHRRQAVPAREGHVWCYDVAAK